VGSAVDVCVKHSHATQPRQQWEQAELDLAWQQEARSVEDVAELNIHLAPTQFESWTEAHRAVISTNIRSSTAMLSATLLYKKSNGTKAEVDEPLYSHAGR
jgi:hypothetical protein